MTIKVPLPGGEWAELKDVSDLTGADQDAYWDAYDEIMDAKPRPEPQPDPSNPAVMLPAERPRFTNADGRVIRDKLLAMLVTAWSFDPAAFPLPVTTETRKRLPLPACNALYRAVKPMDTALSGTEDEDPDVPKPGAPSGTGGSSGTSADGTESPLPGSPGEPSGTPQGS
jgi:hypothetical protein